MNKKNVSVNFFFRNIFSPRAIFVRSLHIFFKILFRECSVTFHCICDTQTRSFSALGPETEEQIKLAKNKIRFDLQLSKGDSDARI